MKMEGSYKEDDGEDSSDNLTEGSEEKPYQFNKQKMLKKEMDQYNVETENT